MKARYTADAGEAGGVLDKDRDSDYYVPEVEYLALRYPNLHCLSPVNWNRKMKQRVSSDSDFQRLTFSPSMLQFSRDLVPWLLCHSRIRGNVGGALHTTLALDLASGVERGGQIGPLGGASLQAGARLGAVIEGPAGGGAFKGGMGQTAHSVPAYQVVTHETRNLKLALQKKSAAAAKETEKSAAGGERNKTGADAEDSFADADEDQSPSNAVQYVESGNIGEESVIIDPRTGLQKVRYQEDIEAAGGLFDDEACWDLDWDDETGEWKEGWNESSEVWDETEQANWDAWQADAWAEDHWHADGGEGVWGHEGSPAGPAHDGVATHRVGGVASWDAAATNAAWDAAEQRLEKAIGEAESARDELRAAAVSTSPAGAGTSADIQLRSVAVDQAGRSHANAAPPVAVSVVAVPSPAVEAAGSAAVASIAALNTGETSVLT